MKFYLFTMGSDGGCYTASTKQHSMWRGALKWVGEGKQKIEYQYCLPSMANEGAPNDGSCIIREELLKLDAERQYLSLPSKPSSQHSFSDGRLCRRRDFCGNDQQSSPSCATRDDECVTIKLKARIINLRVG